jgi:hypothetical protein
MLLHCNLVILLDIADQLQPVNDIHFQSSRGRLFQTSFSSQSSVYISP